MSEPTQTMHPWRATARTVAQTVIGGILALGIVLPIAWGIVQDELAKQDLALPEGAAAIGGVIVAVVVAVSAILARIMAIPQVDALLHRIGLSADPADPVIARRAAD